MIGGAPVALWISAAVAVALAGCATTAPPTVSPGKQWQSDLGAYREQRATLAIDVRQVLDQLQTLRAEASFPGLEDKIASLAARVARGEERDDDSALTRSLYSLTLGELLIFRQFLALSSRVVELEATHAELESRRLDLALRRLGLELGSVPGAELVNQPLAAPFACPRYRVGRIEFVSCR